MNSDFPASDIERTEAITWLREVFVATLEVAPLPQWATRIAARFLWQVPDWLLGRWADSVGVDFEYAYLTVRDLPSIIRSDAGKAVVRCYIERHRVVPTARELKGPVRNVITMALTNTLSDDAETIQNQVAALALSQCTARGVEFAKQAAAILNTGRDTDRLLGAYDTILRSRDAPTVKGIDSVLNDSRHGCWVADRLKELKRWLRGGTELNIHWEVETLPDNGGIYQFLLEGGKKNES